MHDRRRRSETKVGGSFEGRAPIRAGVVEEHANCADEKVVEEQVRPEMSELLAEEFIYDACYEKPKTRRNIWKYESQAGSRIAITSCCTTA